MMNSDLLFFLALLLSHIHRAHASSSCYYQNGTRVGPDIYGGAYIPCTAKGGMCCALGRPAGSDIVNTCRSDGLCESPGNGEVFRESCADPTWKDPRCVRLCLNTLGKIGDGLGDIRITPCVDGSYCCGHRNQDCCYNRLGVWIVNLTVTNQKPQSLAPISTWDNQLPASISTALPNSSVTRNILATASPNTSTNPTLSAGAIAGISIGAIIGLLACLTTIFLLCKQRYHSRKIDPPNPEVQQWSRSEMAAHPVVDRKQIANELDGVVCETYEMAGDRSVLVYEANGFIILILPPRFI